MRDFLMFRRMVAPILVVIVFLIGTVWCLASVWSAVRDEEWLLAAYWIAGAFLFRLVCEGVILLFRMNETLTDIHRAELSTADAVRRNSDG